MLRPKLGDTRGFSEYHDGEPKYFIHSGAKRCTSSAAIRDLSDQIPNFSAS
jgi:hypothetical protein